MGSTTQYLKFPFPVSSDLVADGAINMEQLADAVEEVMIVPSNSLAMNAGWNQYPIGASMMQVTNSSDWPSSGIVYSLRRQGGDQTHQYWSGTSVSDPQVAFRYGSSGGWSRWIVLGSTGAPQEMAADTVTITTKANDYKTTKVTLPSGRFSTAPRVFLQYNGSAPHAIDYSTDDRTATSFSVITWANTSWAAAIQWTAIKMTTDIVGVMAAPMAEPAPEAMALAAEGDTEAICQTEGCVNYLTPIDVGSMTSTDESTGEVREVDEVICGGCNWPVAGLGAAA
jgi:hypothetical protein